jgi:hypothetical protein
MELFTQDTTTPVIDEEYLEEDETDAQGAES